MSWTFNEILFNQLNLYCQLNALKVGGTYVRVMKSMNPNFRCTTGEVTLLTELGHEHGDVLIQIGSNGLNKRVYTGSYFWFDPSLSDFLEDIILAGHGIKTDKFEKI